MNKKGFTLVELMVVIIIMGLLAAVGVPKLIGVIAKSHATEIQPAAASYIKLQKAYMSEKGGVGTWKKIGYAAPGKKLSSSTALTYETSSFTYGGSDVEINATVKRSELATKLSSEKIGWIAKNRNALNECTAGNQWVVKIVAINDTTVQYKASASDVSAACVALVPSWDMTDYGYTYKDGGDATKTIDAPEDIQQSPTTDDEEDNSFQVDAQEAQECAKINGWLNGVKGGWEVSKPDCFKLRQTYFTNGILTCVGNDLGTETSKKTGETYEVCTKFDYTALGRCKIFDECVVETGSSSSTVIVGSGDNTGSGDGAGSSSASSSGGIPGTPAGTGAESSNSSETLSCSAPADQSVGINGDVSASVTLTGCNDGGSIRIQGDNFNHVTTVSNTGSFSFGRNGTGNGKTYNYTLTVTCGGVSKSCGSFNVTYSKM